MMTVGEMKEILEDLDDDVEIRMQYQPNYPLESRIDGCVTSNDLNDACDDESESAPTDNILYILEGKQVGYGLRACWDIL